MYVCVCMCECGYILMFLCVYKYNQSYYDAFRLLLHNYK